MKASTFIGMSILAALSLGCSNRTNSTGSQGERLLDSTTVAPSHTILAAFPVKTLPLVDSTNFDNLNEAKTMESADIETLQLSELDFAGSGMFTARYSVRISEGFVSLVVTYWASDVEMYTYLVNYDSNMNRIDQLPISYDEIAEGYMQKQAQIGDGNNIVVVSENRVSGELLRTETKYKCLEDGTFVENK